MKNLFKTLALSLVLISLATSALAAGVVVEANPDSKTGYTATFTYENAEAANVQIMGGFTFYEVNNINALGGGRLNPNGDIVGEDLLTPETWFPGAARYGDAGYVADMTNNDGVWTISVDLPSGSFLYQYIVTDKDGNATTITDPANVPAVNALGASQTRSQFYVPFDASKHAAEDDWTFVTPIEDASKAGQVIWTEYEGAKFEGQESATHQMMIYLPAGYDAERAEAYKVLYLVHGGGGEEGDWIHQGNANNVVDRLIANGDAEPFIIAMIDISKGSDVELVNNLVGYTVPYMEANYNVSTEVAGRAIAGLSKGAKFTWCAYQYASDKFGYFGAFSVGHPSGEYSILDAVALNKPTLYLAVGYADHTYAAAFFKGQIPMAPYSVYLEKAGVDFIGLDIVEGGHDWFTWPQTLNLFVKNVLWK